MQRQLVSIQMCWTLMLYIIYNPVDDHRNLSKTPNFQECVRAKQEPHLFPEQKNSTHEMPDAAVHYKSQKALLDILRPPPCRDLFRPYRHYIWYYQYELQLVILCGLSVVYIPEYNMCTDLRVLYLSSARDIGGTRPCINLINYFRLFRLCNKLIIWIAAQAAPV